jgi:predicted DCC family thiol-disulfide oxidoreductase YuxK
MEGRVRIYYDGTCRLCSGLIERVEHSAQAGSFEPIRNSTALPDGITYDAAQRDVYVRGRDGRLYRGADAVLHVLSHYPLLRPLAWICSLPLLKQLSAVLYRLIADNRYRIWGRIDSHESER